MDSEFHTHATNTEFHTNCVRSIFFSFQNDSPSEKSQDINSDIVSVLLGQCQCSIDATTAVTNGGFRCFTDSPGLVTYRAQVQGSSEVTALDLIRIIEEWLRTGPSLNVKAQFLNLRTSCQVSIGSLDESGCDTSIATTVFSTEEVTSGNFSPVIIAIIIAIVCVITITVVVILSVIIFVKLKAKKAAEKNR